MKTKIQLLKFDGSREIIYESDHLIFFPVGMHISDGIGNDYRINAAGMFFINENTMTYTVTDNILAGL